MSATANTILDAVVTACAADFSSGDSQLDLSATGLVLEGEYFAPPVGSASPFVAVSPPSIRRASDVWNLGKRGRELECSIGVWAPSPDANSTRRANVVDLASDVAGALDALVSDATLRAAGLVWVEVELDVVDGMEEGMTPGYGMCVLSVSITYQIAAGF